MASFSCVAPSVIFQTLFRNKIFSDRGPFSDHHVELSASIFAPAPRYFMRMICLNNLKLPKLISYTAISLHIRKKKKKSYRPSVISLRFLGKLTSFIQYYLQTILRTYEEDISTVPGSIFVVILTFYYQLHNSVNNSPSSFSLLPSTDSTSEPIAAQCLKLLDSISFFALVSRKLRTKSVAHLRPDFSSAEPCFSNMDFPFASISSNSFFFLFIFQCVANKSSKSSLEHGWKVNKGHRVTSLLCFRLPSGSMPFFMQKPLALSSLSQQSRCQPTVLMLWSTCHSHLPVYSQQPPSILALLILHLASFVAGFSHNWLLLILHPLHLIVRTSLDTFIIKFPYTLLFLSCLLCSFPFILIYIFYLSVV